MSSGLDAGDDAKITVSRNCLAGERHGRMTGGELGFGCALMRLVFFLRDDTALKQCH